MRPLHFPQLTLLAAALCLSLSSSATASADLDSLEYYLARRDSIDLSKLQRISRYTDSRQLFDEYASFVYDSASLYCIRMHDESLLSGDNNRYVDAQVKRSFLYLSGGLFKEAADILEHLDLSSTDTATRFNYYTTYSRLLYDLADYNRSELSPDYLRHGNAMTDSAIALLPTQDTALFWYLTALKDMKQQNYIRALERFEHQLTYPYISLHDMAITYSSMAYICEQMGQQQLAQHYNIIAAIYDIRNSTKEALALQNVARQLYKENDIERAARYIRIANDDAQYYNARHRKQQIAEILPIIEGEQMRLLGQQNRRIQRLSIFLYVTLALLCIGIGILYNRIRAIRRAEQTIRDINSRLSEANKIKERYLGTFLCWQSDFLNQLEHYQRQVRRKAKEKKYEELMTMPQNFNANKKRKEFNRQFDEMFLSIFPHFVDDFNNLLRPEERYQLREGEFLNTELRIFALERLGLTDNEKIAQVLDYSVTTIYTYKTRVRQKSDLTPAQLRQRLMEI